MQDPLAHTIWASAARSQDVLPGNESGAAERVQLLTLCSVRYAGCGDAVVVPAGKSAAKGKQATYGLNISSDVK